jgi:hypothetical protein
VIIEAFAKYLHAADPATPASSILARWLWERLTSPPQDATDRVLRCEIEVELRSKPGTRWNAKSDAMPPRYHFSATSDSGKRLLKSLYEYALSYEQQKWSRWVHVVKASDFNRVYNGD